MDGFWDSSDLFFLFRRMLVVIVTVYAVVKSLQTLVRWVAFLYQPHRPWGVLRHYVALQFLRVRWRRFWPDYVHIGLLSVLLLFLVYLHDLLGLTAR